VVVRLDADDFRRLVGVVQNLPEFSNVRDRRRLLEGVLEGVPQAQNILGQLDLDGRPMPVAVGVVKFLADFGQVSYGREALGVFLNYVLPFVGDEARAFVTGLFARYPLDAPAVLNSPISDWRGTETIALVQERIIGEDTLRDVRILALALAATSAVVRLRVGSDDGQARLGSGFMVANDLVMTNHHVVSTSGEAGRTEVAFNYELDVNGRPRSVQVAHGLEGRLFHSNADLDYAVFQLRDVPPFGQPLILRGTVMKPESRVAIIQHPLGSLKKIAMQNNHVAYADQRVIQYYTPTDEGSSGSPVFDEDYRVVAIHHSGGRIQDPKTQRWYIRNVGTSMIAVLADLRSNAPEIAARLG
jgi:hypothetical protein